MGRQRYSICPRCGGSLEILQSYAHCASCLYFEDYWFDYESAFNQARKAEKEMVQLQEESEQKDEEAYDDKESA